MSEGVILKTRPLGEILLAKGQIRKFQLDFLLVLQKAYSSAKRHIRLGDLLLKHRVVTEATLLHTLKTQNEAPLESVTEILKVFEQEMSFRTRHSPVDDSSQQ
mgnify:CR=1 FL=1